VFGYGAQPMLSGFPLALFSTSLLWELAALVTHQSMWWKFAFWSIALGLVAAPSILGSGLCDNATLVPTTAAVATTRRHGLAMLSAVMSFACSLIWLRPDAAPVGLEAALAVGCCGLGLSLLLVRGWLGGDVALGNRTVARRRDP
jgi:uncharacterized membrane protein